MFVVAEEEGREDEGAARLQDGHDSMHHDQTDQCSLPLIHVSEMVSNAPHPSPVGQQQNRSYGHCDSRDDHLCRLRFILELSKKIIFVLQNNF